MFARFGRWALGLYPPSAPADLRLTDVRASGEGLTQIVSAVELSAHDRERIQTYQQRQHEARNTLQEMQMARELEGQTGGQS